MGTTAASMALQMGMEYVMNSQNAKATNRVEQARVDARAASLRRAGDIEERRKHEELKRIAASQRASFAAQGTGGRGGSADAVIGGLTRTYNQNIADSRSLAQTELSGLQATLGASKRANLLEASNATRRFIYSSLKKNLPEIKKLLS